MIGGAGKADFSGKACINNNYESTMLDFSDDNNLIAGNQVDAGSASYYYQVDGLYDRFGHQRRCIFDYPLVRIMDEGWFDRRCRQGRLFR